MTARAHTTNSCAKTAFHADQFAIAVYGSAIAESGIEQCSNGWRLWIETEQGDVHSRIYHSFEAAEDARDLFC